jgi:hypothetical protein
MTWYCKVDGCKLAVVSGLNPYCSVGGDLKPPESWSGSRVVRIPLPEKSS